MIRNAGAITMELAYGWTVKGTPDRFVTMMEKAIAMSSELTQPGRWLVDVMPLRKCNKYLTDVHLLTWICSPFRARVVPWRPLPAVREAMS